ncbi:MAG: URC4/urg3 family protein [Methylobacterium sp.]|uniref:URC4/urg3 family protein n=1 Tax=Methylobacterium sp. TaxID=409 RepID=UPI002589B16E|nr:URC4/urg3 family protein [Methylobacterium sp.]MBY0295212.1 URC4/urg3 family protein [Methylobacterium sp.]
MAQESTGAGTRDARWLLTTEAVRERAAALLARGLDGGLDHFAVDPDRLGPCADAVVETIRDAYPDLDIPYHSRWRHFAVDGFERWGSLVHAAPWDDRAARARAAFDLVIVSVLIDAGAGPTWRYEEGRTGETYARSEGLAVASFDLFVSGLFSEVPEDPFRVDARALASLTEADLAQGFQVSPTNPLVGLSGRTALLNRLGQVVAADPDGFGPQARPGGLYDRLAGQAQDGALPASAILAALLTHLGPIWPGRIALKGIDLGDTWRHPRAGGEGETAGLVPFHKLSQWLAYSLLEPLEEAGLTVTGLDALTGLPEYRNGGLFLDTGVLALKRPEEAGRPHAVGSELVVEWRALTVALLDRLAPLVRERLGIRDPAALPLAKVLEGGTWATGRRLARGLRPDGTPPLTIESDGTVF